LLLKIFREFLEKKINQNEFKKEIKSHVKQKNTHKFPDKKI